MNLDIPNRAFDGSIFDCDGTLADTIAVGMQRVLVPRTPPDHFSSRLARR
jgi:hypothetical protein